MQHDPDSPEHHRRRSEFIRQLVQYQSGLPHISSPYAQGTPRTIFQFWHDRRELPEDVQQCINSWARWENRGFTHRMFDERSAKAFIARSLDARHQRAFARCYHPAMQADYFRLCYLLIEGGVYVDADDVCVCADIECLFGDGRLKLQPLCYDINTGTMVEPAIFLRPEVNEPSWIFYFNNNPLIARRGHPIIEHALCQATSILDSVEDDVLPEIQGTTGPGNLSKSIFTLGLTTGDVESDLTVLRNWDSIAISKWPLSYRNDARNWRHSNQQRFCLNRK